VIFCPLPGCGVGVWELICSPVDRWGLLICGEIFWSGHRGVSMVVGAGRLTCWLLPIVKS